MVYPFHQGEALPTVETYQKFWLINDLKNHFIDFILMFAYFPFSIKKMPQALIHYSAVYFQIQNVITFSVSYIHH